MFLRETDTTTGLGIKLWLGDVVLGKWLYFVCCLFFNTGNGFLLKFRLKPEAQLDILKAFLNSVSGAPFTFIPLNTEVK